jgi:uncharacterized oxidoreductase
MMPMGGLDGSHKGYVLNFMIEALADVLSGQEFAEDPSRPYYVIDGSFMALFRVEAFRPLADWNRDLRALIDYVKSSAPADGSPGVFFPGERSHLSAVERARTGVPIPEDVWERVVACAERWGAGELVPEPL